MSTATAYEAALAAVPNAKRTRLPGPSKAPRKKDRIKDEAGKAIGKVKAGAAKPTAKARGAGNGSGPATRITMEWMSAEKKDVGVKDEVTVGGVTIKVIGRWTKRRGDKLIPMVTGRIVSGAPDGKKKGDRHNAVAAEVTHR